MDPDQTAPTGRPRSTLSMRLQIFQLTTKTYDVFGIFALRANKCEFSVFTVRIFMKCTHVCAAQTTCSLFTKL